MVVAGEVCVAAAPAAALDPGAGETAPVVFRMTE